MKIELTESYLKACVKKKMGVSVIAKESGSSNTNVRFLLEKYGLPTTTRNYTVNKIDFTVQDIVDDLEEGLTIYKIAKKRNCSQGTLMTMCKKAGINYLELTELNKHAKVEKVKPVNNIDKREEFQAQREALAVQHAMNILLTPDLIKVIRSLRTKLNSKSTSKITNKKLIQKILTQALNEYLK